jgi:hypothetical protein
MTSHINSNSINGSFPVAGQANDSQGFRDNFTNTKNNFVFAKSEIEDLQNKVILKAPLDGTTTISNNLDGVVLSSAITHNFTETVYEHPQAATGQIDYTLGNYQKMTTYSGPMSLVFSKWPAPGLLAKIKVQIDVVNAGDTITFPSSVSLGLIQVPGIDVTTRKITPPAPGTGTYVLEFSTIDGGTTIAVKSLIFPGSMLGIESIPGIQGNIYVLHGNVTVLEGNVTALKSNIAALDSNVAVLHSNVAVLRSDVLTINSDVGIVASHVVAVESNVAVINSNVAVVASNVLAVQSNVGVLQSNVTSLQHNGIVVKVVEDGSGVQEVFELNGNKLKSSTGVLLDPPLWFVTGKKYRFDLSDPSNDKAPLRFSKNPDIAVPASLDPYTTGVTIVGTAGTAGAYIQIDVTKDTPKLFMYGDESGSMIDTSNIGASYPIYSGYGCCYVGSENLINAAAADRSSVSYFTSVAPTLPATTDTATLAAGQDGQHKTFIANDITAGSMVITVTNAGWVVSGTGTITFNARGQSCMLQYINDKWFCIGNNGAAFA